MKHFCMVLFCMAGAWCAWGEATFRRPMERVTSMDPATCEGVPSLRAVGLAYEALLEYDYHARPYALQPSGAVEMPEITEGGKVYTFRLRPESRFHPDPCFGFDADGKPKGRQVTAADYVFAIKRLGDRKNASSASWMIEEILGMKAFSEASTGKDPTDYTREVPGLRAIDDLTLRIELERPFVQFLWYLPLHHFAAVPPEAETFYGQNLSRHTVGAGPYILKSWRRDHEMVFERARDWWGWREGQAAFDPAGAERPFDKIIYSVINDASTQWLMFLKGEVDFLGTISRDNWDVIVDSNNQLFPELAARGIVLYSTPTLETFFIGINMDDPLLGKNKALRQALTCAFNFDRWYAFYNGRAQKLTTIAPPHLSGALEGPFAYDFNLELARELMVKAGYPGGTDPATGRRLVLTLDIGRASQDARESAELIASFFNEIGVDLRLEFNNWPAFLKKIANRQSQMFILGWVGDYPDIATFSQPLITQNVSPGANRVNYSNPRADALYEAAVSTGNPEKQKAAWHEFQEIIREDCPRIHTHFFIEYTLAHKWVLNYLPHNFPYGMERFYRYREGAPR